MLGNKNEKRDISLILTNIEVIIILWQIFFNFSGPVDNKTVAARYQGSPGGKITTGGKKKQEPFGMLIINLDLK